MTEIIAEIGINHNGSLEEAIKLVDAAKTAGATTVKFQIYDVDRLLLKSTPKVDYQKVNDSNSRSHYEMLKSCQLNLNEQLKLYQYCNDVSVKYLNTPYDPISLQFLTSIGCNRVKIASADTTDLVLLSEACKSNMEVILSVGMASDSEIALALKYLSNSPRITLLHCVSNYPCSDQALNLQVIKSLQEKYGKNVGFSDHSIGSLASVIAVALGASVIEKHFTLDKSQDGPDHIASSTPEEFATLVNEIRRTEKQIGSGIKVLQTEELPMKSTSRKSAYYADSFSKGKVIEMNNIVMLRPGDGINSIELDRIIGKTLSKPVLKHTRLNSDDFE